MFLHAARQPILDVDQNVYAYELLFRDSTENLFPEIDGDAATSKLVSVSQFEHSLPELTSGHHAHINFNLDSMLKKYPSMMPAEQVSIEIIDIKKPGKRLLQECIELKEAGYKIALDDYVHQKAWIHFYPYIEMIKIDMLSASFSDLRQAVKIKQKFQHIKLAAKKIESNDDFIIARNLGFDFFQGYFFAKPQLIKEKTMDTSSYSLAELLFEISGADFDVDKIIATFEVDVGLTYKLLRYSNSAIFRRAVEISSIKQAVMSLGKTELLKFVTVLFAAKAGGDKSLELISMALLRAKMCEGFALLSSGGASAAMAFLSGMLSLIDAMLDEPLAEVLQKMKLSDDISETLLEGKGEVAAYIKMAMGYENADWPSVESLAKDLSLEMDDVAGNYQESLNWVTDKMQYMVES